MNSDQIEKGEEFWGTKLQFYQIKWWLKDGISKDYKGQNGQIERENSRR